MTAARRMVVLLLFAAAAASAAFVALYVLEAGNAYLGLALGGAFALLSTAAILASKRLVPQRQTEQDIAPPDHARAREEATAAIREGGEPISRRGLLLGAGAAAGATGAALVAPAASLGPLFGYEQLRDTPWREGRRLVDAEGEPVFADDIEVGSFVTAFPEGAEPGSIDSSLVVCRMRTNEIAMPPEREDWAPEGIAAYSRICTHAACAVSQFEYPVNEPTSVPPRLVCPCHYSVFDPVGGGGVLDGPAGRDLPQLPLRIEEDRALVAAGGFSAPPGPSWAFVRE